MIISTDSTSNLPKEYYKQKDIKMIPLQIIMDENVYDDLSPELPLDEFYKKMASGSHPKTAQVNVESAREYFLNLLSTGEDILHISFSSALSGTTPSLKSIAQELNLDRNNKLYVFDSLNASMGEGLLTLKAWELKEQGKSVDEILNELNELKDHACSFFTPESLKYLVRGGRVSKFSGIIGTILNIKPVLHVNNLGQLVAYKKTISRKRAIQELVETCLSKRFDDSPIFITHAQSEEDATILQQKIESATNVKPIICDLTQVIGCHTGPGLLSIFFFGKEK